MRVQRRWEMEERLRSVVLSTLGAVLRTMVNASIASSMNHAVTNVGRLNTVGAATDER